MYQKFYNLTQSPFRLSPDPTFLCMTTQHSEAFSALVYSVCTRPGLTVLTGEAGTGKTTLLYMLLGLLAERGFITAMCTNPTLTREEFYDTLLIHFGVTCASPLKSRQLSALKDQLARNRAAGHPSLLIIDEAHRLSPELLEEVRLLMNMETPEDKFLELILVGQPELNATLARSDLRQLKQRVRCFCKLEPLSVDDLREYINHRLSKAGLPDQAQEIFPAAIIQLIHSYTSGIPRLVNNLCEGALLVGLALEAHSITEAIIREVANDLDLHEPSFDKDWHKSDRSLVEELDAAVAKSSRGLKSVGRPIPAPPSPSRMPLESYTTRQRNVGFIGGLLDRWR